MAQAQRTPVSATVPNDLEPYWMPFTANRAFKARPRLIARAKDMFYFTPDGRKLIDGSAGLWCTNAGHNRDPIVEAIQAQAAELDYAPAFQFGHPKAFELAARVAALAPGDLDHVFFCNSGSEAVDTALKDRARLSQCARASLARAADRARARLSRRRLRRRRGRRHRRRTASSSARSWPASIICRTTYNREKQAFSIGEPEWGAHLADELDGLVALHDASTIAAVIVEPVACSTGVLAPPKGYLERLRAICDKHGILLIFDEVITGFGRMGYAFAAERYGVVPDMITFAKGITSGSVPMGGVLVRKGIYDAFMKGPEHVIELFHGYTYSAHPLACAAGLATLDLYREEGLFERARKLEKPWAEAAMKLKGLPNVLDIRPVGMTVGIDLASKPDGVGKRGFEALELAFHEHDLMMRAVGDTLAMSPPLIVTEDQIGELFDKLATIIKAVA